MRAVRRAIQFIAHRSRNSSASYSQAGNGVASVHLYDTVRDWKPEFASYAKTHLVMVMLDFPKAKNQSEALKKNNDELQTKFKVDGFPTYVALNADGKEIGRQVGYLSGGPQAFIAELEKFQKK